jgi:cyclophilin family peptidyl-prolyl cis-trans isomerase
MKRLLAAMLVVLAMLATGNAFAKDNPMVKFETTEGNFTVELYADKAPLTVDNFMWYVDNNFYDGLIFHRIIKDFMVQGGGFTPEMKKKAANPPIENEATNGLKNEKYTVAMARTNAVHSATSQFFINTKDNGFLDHQNTTQKGFGYCVFGKVVDGKDTIDAMNAVPTTSKSGYNDVPKTAVVIKAAYRVDAKGKKIEKEKK